MMHRSPGEEKPGWGTYVGDRINSQHHQHMFCARLDLAVDDDEGGKGLQVSEVGTHPCLVSRQLRTLLRVET